METAFILTRQELDDLISQAVQAAIAELESRRGQEQEARLLSREAVSERLHVGYSTLWRWEKEGYLKPVRLGRRVYYRAGDVQRLERGEFE